MENRVQRTTGDRRQRDVLPRRAHRVVLNMPVWMELVPGCLVNATIVDLSAEGFRLTSESMLYVGEAIQMHMPKGSITCELRWVDGLEAGGIFLEKVQVRSW